jgi:pimeloyl-ACP methyl ester carboxylesterase
VPVRVLRARERGEGGAMDMSSSPTAPGLAGRFPRGEDLYLPRHSHFIPMEDPALVAGEVVAMLARLGEVE